MASLPAMRPVQDRDGPGILALVGRCFADYPGCVLEVASEEVGLRTPAQSFGWFVVLEVDGWIVGTVGAGERETPDGRWVELKKLYVHPDLRGQRLGRLLVDALLQRAHDRGAVGVELWSDTRFTTAHAVYERMGWERGPEIRPLHDLSHTEEFYFSRRI